MPIRVTKVLSGFLALFICFSGITAGQAQGKRNFSPPPDSLFNEARYPANPDVPFIYSLKELNITFEESNGSVVAVMDYHVRVKVFDASVPQASVIGIPYYEQNGIEKITSIHAVTWNSPTDSTVLDDDAIRTINLNARYNLKEFTMPDVQDGSVLEYSYQIRRRYIEELPAFYLANQMPTVLSKVSITYPQYLRYNAIIQDFGYDVKHKKVMMPVEEAPEIFTNPQPDPIIKEVWTARNIPAVRKEEFISTLSDYRGKIKFQLSEFGIPRQPLENSWQYVVEEIRQKQQLFETIKGNKKAFRIGESIRKAVSSKRAAQDSIFQYLLNQVDYSGENTPFSSTSAEVVLSGEKANQAAINQTLIAMLHGAGIKAFPVLISTRKSGKINKGYPSFFQFNGQLVRTKISGTTYLMDASFSHSEPGLIPVETYNQTGLLLKEKDFRWIEIEPRKSIFAIQINMDAELLPNGTLTGHIETSYTGYPARTIRIKKSNGLKNATILKTTLFDGYSSIRFSNVRLSHYKNYNQPIKISADFTIPGYATAFTGGVRFRPMVVGYLMSNPFNEQKRELPVTLNAPEKLDLTYTITLPEGYTLQTDPEDKILRLPGAVFREHYETEGRTLKYEFYIEIAKKHFRAELYPRLMNLYERWVRLSKTRWFVK